MSASPHKLLRVLSQLLLIVATCGAVCGCKREQRDFHGELAPGGRGPSPQLSTLEPGGSARLPPKKNPYENNAFALAEGKRLFTAFNCVGCHGHGGGGMGPALMDSAWRYGSEPEQIFATIMDGRPNGMPSFRAHLAVDQAWQLAAYVRSLSGAVRMDAAPNRDDHLKANPPENSVDPVQPRSSPDQPPTAP